MGRGEKDRREEGRGEERKGEKERRIEESRRKNLHAAKSVAEGSPVSADKYDWPFQFGEENGREKHLKMCVSEPFQNVWCSICPVPVI